jgi:dTDP-4-amino-4,6-dideoxygalactose transaminase
MKAEQLAIAGGEPAKKTPYGSGKRYGSEELQELKEALDQNSLFYAHGRKVHELEEEFARFCGTRFAIATSSGTASIHTAMIALGISPGDEVITSPITDMGSVIAILFQGGVPVFADINPETHVLSPEAVEAAITPRTRAVLAVHLWGNACDLDRLGEICRRRQLHLIEDCAQAYCCQYNGRYTGTFGIAGCFSLNEFKHISCGDGGLVITDDEELAIRLRLATDKGYDRRPGATTRNPDFLAANYRMTELQGAVARAQLRKLPSIVARRREWCTRLLSEISGLDCLQMPSVTPGCDPSWWFLMFRVVPGRMGVSADEFARALQAEGIPAAAHYIGRCIYEYDLFVNHSAFANSEHPFKSQQYGPGICPRAEELLRDAIVIPVNENYTMLDCEETAAGIRKCAAYFSASARTTLN